MHSGLIERANQALDMYTGAKKWQCDHDEVLQAAYALSSALREIVNELS